MKKQLIVCIALGVSVLAFSQSLTLDSCQIMARQNHPLLKQAGVIEDLYNLRRKSIGASNLPQIDLSGRASYQSDVVEFNLPIPNFKAPEFSKDQYKVYVDVKQKIYDFGLTSSRKAVETADRNINQQQNEVELYKIKESVNSLYFTALILQENTRILALKKQSLEERIKLVRSAVKNGMVLPNELDNLRAESLLTDQQQMELRMNKQTSLALLGILIGADVVEETVLSQPSPPGIIESLTIDRPEIKLFGLQQEKLNQSARMLGNTRMPYLYAFGQAGFGRPGLNMLSNELGDWYIGGVGFAWNLWDGNKVKRDKSAILLQKKSIDIVRENFERSIQMGLKQEINTVTKLEQLLVIDKELVDLKDKIAQRSAVALDNGSLTSADYIRDLNAALQAQAMLNLHQVQLLQAQVNYHTIKGE